MEVRPEDFDGKPTNYKDALAQKKSQSSKHEAARVKHNRNATSGLELPDREKEQSTEDRITEKLQTKRGHRHVARRDSKDKVIMYRSMGLTYDEIAQQPATYSRRRIYELFDEDPNFKEACENAYDSYVSRVVEHTLGLIETADETDGLSRRPLDIIEHAYSRVGDEELPAIAAANTELRAAEVMIHHGRNVASTRLERVSQALKAAQQRLPKQWGRDRDQEQEVIVIETPGRWLSEAVNATPTQDDGQGKEAQLAISKWKQIRDNAEDTE